MKTIHYVECPKCESCFKVAKTVTTIPAHKCWAEEKAQAGRFELAVLAAHEASRAELERRGVPSRVVAEGVEWRQSPMRAMSYSEENRGRMVPIGPVDLEPAVFVGSLAEGPFVLKVTGPNTAQVRVTMRVLYSLTW